MNAHRMVADLNNLAILYRNYIDLQNKRASSRRWWAKPHLRYNYLNGYGAFRTVFLYFKLNDEEEFYNFTRFPIHQFNYIFETVEQYLIKSSIRPALPPEVRFACVINYLVCGDNIEKNAWFFNIGKTTMYELIPEVCQIICLVIGSKYLRTPSTGDLKRISEEFHEKFDFPHCIGALDGRHCPIKQPPNSGSAFYNYKKFFSIVLMAICDAHKRFTFVNLGGYGSMNDASIWQNSDICSNIENEILALPAPDLLPNSEIVSPYHIIADGGFALKNYLLKPYMKTNNMTIPMRVFNFRLSRARYIIESAFGCLSNTWKVNQVKLGFSLPKIEAIILASICLHNCKITLDLREERGYINHWIDSYNNQVDENVQENPIHAQVNFNAMEMRNCLKDYFVSDAGAVPYQWQYI